MRAHKPHLAVLRADVGLANADVAVADRLDLGAQEREPCLDGAQDVVVVGGFAIDGNGLLAQAALRQG